MSIDRRIVLASCVLGVCLGGCTADSSSGPEPSGSTVSHEDRAAPSLNDTSATAATKCSTLTDTVTAAYRMALLREPDPSGESYWLLQLQSGMAPLDMLGDFVRSSEFTATHAGLSDTQFVTGLYGGFLDRAPDSPGFIYWTNALTTGISRTNVALSFVDSDEFRNDGLHGCFF
jgi:hypothetical protein